jgi:hypothetical protein
MARMTFFCPEVAERKFLRNVYSVACRPAARQPPRNNQLYKSRCYVTALQTNMFQRQQLHCNRGTVFPTQPVSRCYKQDYILVSQLVLARASRNLEVSQSVSVLVREMLRFRHCKLLLLEADS